jgi:hypothetical protein
MIGRREQSKSRPWPGSKRYPPPFLWLGVCGMIGSETKSGTGAMATGEGRSGLGPATASTNAVPATRTRARQPGAGGVLVLMIGVAVLWVVVLAAVLRGAALGPDAGGTMFVVFPPATAPAEAFAAIVGAGGEPVRPALGDWGWIVHADAAGFVGRLERNGALAAFRGAPAGLSLTGCFAWALDRPPQDPFARALEARAAASRR